MSILPLIVVLIIVIDKYCFSRILQRPIITCTLLGAALGCLQEGMVIGGSLELYYIAYQSYGEYAPVDGGFLLSSILATILVGKGMDSSTVLSSSIIFLCIGMAAEYALNSIYTVFVPAARIAAEKHDEKKLSITIFAPLLLNLIVYGGVTVASVSQATAFQNMLSNFLSNGSWSNISWMITFVNSLANLMPCIAFAILLRNVGSKDVPGIVLAGIATGSILCCANVSVISGTIVGFIGIALACYDFHANKKVTISSETTSEKKAANTIKGGAEKWW